MPAIARRLAWLWISCVVVMGDVAMAQQDIRVTVSAGHAPVFLWVKHLKETFIPVVDGELAKTGKYKITWNEAYGGSLAKLGSELETIEQGVSDMGFIGTVFHPGKLPLQNMTFALPFGPTDPRLVTRIMNGLHDSIPDFGKSWERRNQVFLAGISVEDYALVTTFPVAKVDDLNGRKIGSVPVALPWVKGSGAVGVAASLSAYYNDIKSGIYAGTIIFASGAVPAKLYEVAPHFTQVGFGAMYAGAVSVNKRSWDRFPDDVKAAFLVAAKRYEAAFHDEQEARSISALETYRANSGRVTQLSDVERKALANRIDDPTRSWIAQAETSKLPARAVIRAYMTEVRAAGASFARDWDAE
jgi:TRAP-type C4-dicarboxylate transport system substrate-binding protein